MYLKNILLLSFGAVSCVPGMNKTMSTTINGTKIECPAAGTAINCMPRLNEEMNTYCRPEVREWVVKNCKNIQYSD